MGQFWLILKDHLWGRKWAILLLGGLIGLFAYGMTSLINTINLTEILAIFESFPEGLLDFFGGAEAMGTPYGFLNAEIFNMIWLYGGLFTVFLAGRVLSSEVEDKTIELALTKPVKRNTFLGSKIAYLFALITGMMGLTFLITTAGVSTSQVFIDQGLNLDLLWATYPVTILFLGTLAMLSMLFSTIFLNSKKAIAFGIVTLFVMFFLGSFYIYLPAEAESVKYASMFFYYNPTTYLVQGSWDILLRDLLVLGAINVGLIVTSLVIFNKKEIPI